MRVGKSCICLIVIVLFSFFYRIPVERIYTDYVKNTQSQPTFSEQYDENSGQAVGSRKNRQRYVQEDEQGREYVEGQRGERIYLEGENEPSLQLVQRNFFERQNNSAVRTSGAMEQLMEAKESMRALEMGGAGRGLWGMRKSISPVRPIFRRGGLGLKRWRSSVTGEGTLIPFGGRL